MTLSKLLKLTLALLLIFSSNIMAQYGPTLASGRPGNANGAGTVGKGILQFQAGFQYNELKLNYEDEPYFQEYSENLVIRFGLTERFELSTVLNYSDQRDFRYDTQVRGFNTTMLRARYRPLDNLAIQVGMNFPALSNDFNRTYASPQIRVMYNTVFSDQLNLTTNLGAQWDDPQDDPNGFYVLSLSAALPYNFSLIIESYGDFNIYGLRNYYDVGLAYLLNPDLLLDVNAGWGNNPVPNTIVIRESFFITTGFSYRLKTGFRD